MKKILISDFTIKEVPHGGSEWVNQVLIEKFNLDFEYSQNVNTFDLNNFYIISNISLMKPDLVRQIPNLNYIIIENDYKFTYGEEIGLCSDFGGTKFNSSMYYFQVMNAEARESKA